jgi:AraC-like DNA-binding protein
MCARHYRSGMRPEVEFLSLDAGRDWSFRTRALASFDFAWHAHDEFELTVVAEGTGRRFAGDGASPYAPGDVTLFGPRLPHTYVSDVGVHQKAYVVHFTDGFLRGLLGTPEFAPVSQLLLRADRGVVVAEPGHDLRRDIDVLSSRSGMRQTIALLDVLVDLAEEAATTLAASSSRRSLAAESADAVTEVVGYLEDNFRQPVLREEVAAAVSMSPSSVSRLLRRHLGTSLTDYVLTLRLDAVCRELVDTERPIAAIAYDCGFTNLANFNRQFRQRRSLTPRDYRRTFRAEPGGPARR